MPAAYAMRAQRYMHDFGYSIEDLARVSVKNRRNGTANPAAQFREPVTVDDVLASRPVSDPLTLLQCCANSDGAAAVLVTTADVARRLGRPAITVEASVVSSGTYHHGWRDATWPDITANAVRTAYDQADVTPDDIDVAEVHDAFSVAECLYYEAMGFVARGEGARALAEGAFDIDGRVAVNPSGGLLSRGHAIGASGVAQVVEAYRQLTDQADGRQVQAATTALTHVTGGGIEGVENGACGVHVFAGPGR